MGVASHIMPVTVHAKSLNYPEEFTILEQNYEYDLMNADKLLDKYVGKRIKIIDWNKFQDRKEVVEAREAPLRCGEKAAGRVPQEQSGKGAPISAARTTAPGPLPPSTLPTISIGTQACTSPAAIRPNSSQGADIRSSVRVL